MGAVDARFEHAQRAIDALHDEDPAAPAERRYAEHMSTWLLRFEPDADPLLRLAVRAQHLKRWERPRGDYPADRAGYLSWRRDAARHHADLVHRLLAEAGYPDTDADRVVTLVRKQELYRDPQVQTLEDCACLVFLEHELEGFLRKHPREKVLAILIRTWKKMSPRARDAALALKLPPDSATALQQALSGSD